MDIKTFWKLYGRHIEAFMIIGLLILVWFTYSTNNELQKKINENCGWEEETYRCFCGKDIVQQLELKYEQLNNNLKLPGDFYVPMDR
jgi:hypothetical protein